MEANDTYRPAQANVGVGAVLFAFGMVILAATRTIEETHTTDPLGPRFLPRVLAVVLMLLSVMLVVDGALQIRAKRSSARKLALSEEKGARLHAGAAGAVAIAAGDRSVLLFIAAMAFYVALMPILGYALGSFVFFIATLALAGQRRPGMLIAQAIGTMVALYLLFGVILRIDLPDGVLPLPLFR